MSQSLFKNAGKLQFFGTLKQELAPCARPARVDSHSIDSANTAYTKQHQPLFCC